MAAEPVESERVSFCSTGKIREIISDSGGFPGLYAARLARFAQGHTLFSHRKERAQNPGFLHEIPLNLRIPAATLFQENHQ